MSETFYTPRLVATRLDLGDYADYRRLGQDPQVRAWLGGTILSEEETRATLDIADTHWRERGYGIWTLRKVLGGKFVGRVGLRHCPVGGQQEIELLYTLLPEFWNQGLATEAARAALSLGFEQFQLPRIVAFTLPTNIASRRVMEKCGMLYERPIVHAGLPHVLYRSPHAPREERRAKP